MVGQTIAQYEIQERLGAGAMGEIFRAHDTRLAREVAIKVLPQAHMEDPERRRRFLREARAASALNHPNIVTIHDVIFENDAALMVMEFIDGETLAARIARGAVPVQEALGYAIQMADALAVAHDAGIIHRDLKPGNVMITARGFVKILDFGLAKLATLAAGASSSGSAATATIGTPLTVEGSILGTVSYMSPEQAVGKPVDTRSDIFSFGVVLYEMLAGVRPFVGDSIITIISAILRQEVRPISASSPTVPRALDDVLRRCMAKEAPDRFQTMADVRDALTLLKSDSSPHVVVAPPQPARKFPTLAAAAVGTALLAAGAVWWVVAHRTPAPTVVPSASVPAAAVAPPPAAPAPAPAQEAIVPREAKKPAPATPQKVKSAENPPVAPAQQTAVTPAAPIALPTAPAPVPTPPPAISTPLPAVAPMVAVAVPDALPFKIRLLEDVPADAQPGRPLRFTVSQELRIGGTVVVPLHAPVVGEIVEAEKKKLIGGTRMTFRLKTATVPGGALLALRVAASERDTHRPVESSTGPKPGKGVAAVTGTEYMAYTSGQQTVQIPR